MEQVEMDRIYRNMPLKEIPWNIEAPPDALVDLVESEKLKHRKTAENTHNRGCSGSILLLLRWARRRLVDSVMEGK